MGEDGEGERGLVSGLQMNPRGFGAGWGEGQLNCLGHSSSSHFPPAMRSCFWPQNLCHCLQIASHPPPPQALFSYPAPLSLFNSLQTPLTTLFPRVAERLLSRGIGIISGKKTSLELNQLINLENTSNPPFSAQFPWTHCAFALQNPSLLPNAQASPSVDLLATRSLLPLPAFLPAQGLGWLKFLGPGCLLLHGH